MSVRDRLRGPVRRRSVRDDDTAGPELAGSAVASRFSTGDGPAGLLVPDPVFVFSSVRSGSTLLRMILDSHTQICAPHELHLASLEVSTSKHNAVKAMKMMGLDMRTLENLLWDRLLHIRLAESGKSIIVDKTPNTTLQWRRVTAFWPRARPLFLLRHPLRVAESLMASRPDITMDQHYRRVIKYSAAIADAQAAVSGLTVRYEDLTAQPEAVTTAVCDWLGVPWEAAMLDYGDTQHDGKFARGLGDWSAQIKSGRIQQSHPLPAPEEIPAQLHEACHRLGYL